MPNTFQSVNFSTIQELLEFIPESERLIVEHLRALIFATIPEVKEKLSYNVPFYFRNKRLCFIWPASIPWGKVSNGVRFGFANGNRIQDEFGYLVRESNKTVASKSFLSIHEIDDKIVIQLLQEARLLDEIRGQKG